MTYICVTSIHSGMSYFKNVKENQTLIEAFWEIPASFVLVIFYFVLITKVENVFEVGLIGSSLIFSFLWFLIIKLFSFKTEVHILPVVSFTESLVKDDFSYFIYRLPGQLLGAILAVLIISIDNKAGYNSLFSIQFAPVHPFLTAIFMGFASQLIYFLYLFLLVKNKRLPSSIKLILFSFGLGIIFFIANTIGNISLLNPFGILLSSLLNGHLVSLTTFLTGGLIHVISPMLFIAGTHYFVTGFIFKKKQY